MKRDNKNPMTEEMKQKLKEATGLNEYQISGSIAQKVFEFFAEEDDKTIHAEMLNQMIEIRKNAEEIQKSLKETEYLIKELQNAADVMKNVEDSKTKDAIWLYSFLINQGRILMASPDKTVEGASYVLYAFFGGQAKREYTFSQNDKKDESWHG